MIVFYFCSIHWAITVKVEVSIVFRNISVGLHIKPTYKKLTVWSQIVKKAKIASLLVDVEFVPNRISCESVH